MIVTKNGIDEAAYLTQYSKAIKDCWVCPCCGADKEIANALCHSQTTASFSSSYSYPQISYVSHRGITSKGKIWCLNASFVQNVPQSGNQKVYFEQLPAIAEALASGYRSVESIKMYGGDSSQLTGNIINSLTQISDGVNESVGIDLKSALMGLLGAKVLGGDGVTINMNEGVQDSE